MYQSCIWNCHWDNLSLSSCLKTDSPRMGNGAHVAPGFTHLWTPYLLSARAKTLFSMHCFLYLPSLLWLLRGSKRELHLELNNWFAMLRLFALTSFVAFINPVDCHRCCTQNNDIVQSLTSPFKIAEQDVGLPRIATTNEFRKSYFSGGSGIFRSPLT